MRRYSKNISQSCIRTVIAAIVMMWMKYLPRQNGRKGDRSRVRLKEMIQKSRWRNRIWGFSLPGISQSRIQNRPHRRLAETGLHFKVQKVRNCQVITLLQGKEILKQMEEQGWDSARISQPGFRTPTQEMKAFKAVETSSRKRNC